MRAETGRLMKENTERPAYDTCADALFAIKNKASTMKSPHFRILISAAKLPKYFDICKYKNTCKIYIYTMYIYTLLRIKKMVCLEGGAEIMV